MKELKAKVPFVPGDEVWVIYQGEVFIATIEGVEVFFEDDATYYDYSIKISNEESRKDIGTERLFKTSDAAEKQLAAYTAAFDITDTFENQIEIS